jgi:post-segregation antitoxin (ccd killing protein)
MATKMVAIALDEHLLDELRELARDEGVPLSGLLAGATEQALRRRVAQTELAKWTAEHGAFTPDELAAARAEMAAADAEFLGEFGGSAAV